MSTSIKTLSKILFTSLLCIISQCAIAQNVDSLMSIFRNINTSDSVRTHLIYNEHLDYLIFQTAHSQPDSAISYSIALLEYSKRNNLKIKMGVACDIIGGSYMFKNDHRNALDYFIQGLKIKESIQDTVAKKTRALIASYHNLGDLYLREKDPDNALIYLSKALDLSKKMGYSHSLAISYTNMGAFYTEKKEYDLADDYYLKSISIYKNLDNTFEFQGNLADLGDANLGKGRVNKSIQYYRDCIDYIDKNNDLATVRSYIGLSKAYGHKADSIFNNTNQIAPSKYSEAIKVGQKGIDLAQKSGFLEYIEEGSELLYTFYKKIGDTENSLKMHELYSKSRESLRSLDAENELLILKYKEDYDKERLLNQLTLQKKAYKRNLLFTSILSLLLVLIILLAQKNIEAGKYKKLLLAEIETLKSNSPKWHLNTSKFPSEDSSHFNKEKIEQFIGAKLNPTDWKILNLLYENPSLTAKEIGNEISLSAQGVYSSLKKMYGLFDLHKSSVNQRLALIIKALKISGYQPSN